MKRQTKILLSVIMLLCLVIAVFGAILFTLTIPSTWHVNTSLGLTLYDSTNTTVVSAIEWTVNALGSQNKSFVLRNTSNKAVNVTSTIPDSTSAYTFTTTFVNVTIDQFSSVGFSMKLTDLAMNNDTSYSGDFKWLIVDHFELGYEEPQYVSFEPSQVFYSADTSGYLEYVSSYFDKANYTESETISYNFTTKNNNASAILQSYTYKIDLYNGSTFMSQLFLEGSPSMLGLDYGENYTITKTFNITESGLYHLHLTYVSHNSETIPPPQPYNYTVVTSNTVSSHIIEIQSYSVSGFTYPNQASSVTLTLKWYSAMACHIHITIDGISGYIADEDSPNRSSGTWSKTWNFNSPSSYGTYTLRIAIMNV